MNATFIISETRWLVLLFFLAIASLCVDSSRAGEQTDSGDLEFPANQSEVRIQLLRAGRFLLAPVKINDADAGYFIVDTGTTRLLLDQPTAAKLHLPRVTSGETHGIGATRKVDVVAAEIISIGGVSVHHTLCGASDLADFNKEFGTKKLSGVLACDFLCRMPFKIDYREATLTLYNPRTFRDPPAQNPLPLRIVNGMPAVEIKLEENASGWFVIDTGSESSIIFQTSFAKLLGEGFTSKPYRGITLVGPNGLQEVRSVKLSKITLAGEHHDVDAKYSMTPIGSIPEWAAGSIGTGFFGNSALIFDYQNKHLWIQYQPDAVPAEWEQGDFDAKEADACGFTPLMRASRLGRADYVKSFLSKGEEIKAIDAKGYTALHYAAEENHPDVVESLLAAGAAVDAKSNEDMTALHLAAQVGSEPIVKMLLASHAQVEAEDQFGRTALTIAAENGREDIVSALIQSDAKVNVMSRVSGSPLHAAAFSRSAAVAALLLKAGAEPNSIDKLHDNSSVLHAAALSGALEVAKVLLANHAEVDAKNSAGQTPLFAAAYKGDSEMVKLLLANGADPNLKDSQNLTPMQFAAASGHLDTAALIYWTSKRPATAPANSR